MKKIILLFLVLGTRILNPSFSQGWEKSYGGTKDDIAYDVIKTADGGYVAVGSTQSFGAGGMDVFVVKINSSGALKWTRVIGGTGNDIAYSVAQSTSGDLVIAGVTGSSGAGGNDVYLIRLTANGKTKWIKTFGSTGNDEGRAVKFSGNNIYVAGSTTLAGSNSNFYLLKTDGGGNLLWEKNYGLTGTETASGMTKTFDGGFALAGYTTSYGNNKVYLVKVNANGDTLFTQNYNEASSSGGAAGIAETTDHGLVMTGRYYDGSGYYNAFLLKVSNTGAQVFNKISTALDDNGDNVYATSDGGAIIAGWNGNFGWTMMLIKYDAAGTQQWRNTGYQYANFNSYMTFSGGNSVIENGVNGYICVGYTRLPSGSNNDFLIIKTDPSGNSYTKPALTASGPTTFCLPGSVTLTAPSGYASYQWTYVNTSHSFTYISGNNTPSYPATAGGYYSCIMKTSANDVIVTNSISVTATPVPTASISASGATSFCAAAGSSVTLTANPSTGFTYQWKLNSIDISGASLSTYSPTASGTYSVVLTNTCGSATSSGTAVSTTLAPSIPVISNAGFSFLIHCANGNSYAEGLISVSAVTGATYQWSANGNLLGQNTNAIFPSVNGASYVCTVSNACGSQASAPVTAGYSDIFGSTNPLTADGPTQGCGVGNVMLHLYQPSNGSYYRWYKNSVQIPGATTDSYLATTSGDYICEYNDFACGIMPSSTTTVTINSSPVAAITNTGSSSVCTGTVTLNATPTGAGITYQWYKDNVLISGATASGYAAGTSGNYKCNVTQPSCGLSVSNTIYISIGVPINNTITASATTICSAATSILSVSAPVAGQTFQWKRNGTTIASATLSSYSTNVAGNYTCDLTNTCGTVSSNSIGITVNTSPAPAISGNTVICPGSNVTLTENSGAGTSYQWYNGNNTISGATLQTYIASTASIYKVRVTAANACTAFSNTITTTAGSIPTSSVTVSQYPVICNNDVITLKTNSAAGYSYQWKKNGVVIPGANDTLYTTSDSGSYSVTVTNICGTVTGASPYTIQLKSLPPATISPQGPTTFCAGGSVLLNANTGTGFTYNWKKNGANISGATASSYTATTAGTYKVVVTNNNSCTKTSAGTVVTVPCREGENLSASAGLDIKAVIYPNPYNEFFTLFIEGENDNAYRVTIKDVTGKIVREQETVEPGTEIQLGQSLEPGCYLVEIISGEMRKTLKIIKL